MKGRWSVFLYLNDSQSASTFSPAFVCSNSGKRLMPTDSHMDTRFGDRPPAFHRSFPWGIALHCSLLSVSTWPVSLLPLMLIVWVCIYGPEEATLPSRNALTNHSPNGYNICYLSFRDLVVLCSDCDFKHKILCKYECVYHYGMSGIYVFCF